MEKYLNVVVTLVGVTINLIVLHLIVVMIFQNQKEEKQKFQI